MSIFGILFNPVDWKIRLSQTNDLPLTTHQYGLKDNLWVLRRVAHVKDFPE